MTLKFLRGQFQLESGDLFQLESGGQFRLADRGQREEDFPIKLLTLSLSANSSLVVVLW